MKLAFLGFEINLFINQIKQQGLFHALRAILWRLKNTSAKYYIHLQDRFGWYRYSDWILENETGPQIQSGSDGNVRFIFLVTHSEHPTYLADTLDSLISQVYSNWEVHACVDDPVRLEELKKSYLAEPRIHRYQLPKIVPINILNNNYTGDWLCFLNAGDTLALRSMEDFVSKIESHPDATIFYSDTDTLSLDGKIRHSPSFWPDWSPELLLSVNFLSHAIFHRHALQETLSQTDNLEDAILRLSEKATRIVHIPHVLFHFREGVTSCWFDVGFTPKSLCQHLERDDHREVNFYSIPISNSIQYTWSFSKPLVSIIILTHDNVKLLESCIDSILSQTAYQPYELVLVENNSQETETFSYYERLKAKAQVKLLIQNQLFNYSAFNNWAVGHAQGDLILFLNNDVECIEPGWLDEMARWALKPEIGIVGAKLLYPNRSIQHAGLVIGLEGHANHVFSGCREGYNGLFGSTEWYRDYSAVTGACMMLRKSVFEQVGGFDEHLSLAFNDVELCLRLIQAGYRVLYTPFARLVHHEGATRSTYKPAPDITFATSRLRPYIEQGDPFYNPNLSRMTRIPTYHRRNEISPLKKLDLLTDYLS